MEMEENEKNTCTFALVEHARMRLRSELSFEGIAVSDYQAVNAGVDMLIGGGHVLLALK